MRSAVVSLGEWHSILKLGSHALGYSPTHTSYMPVVKPVVKPGVLLSITARADRFPVLLVYIGRGTGMTSLTNALQD